MNAVLKSVRKTCTGRLKVVLKVPVVPVPMVFLHIMNVLTCSLDFNFVVGKWSESDGSF